MKPMTLKTAKDDLNDRALDLAEIARRMKPVFTRHHIQKAVVFGSFARGSQSQKSDIDLILIQETGEPYFERYRGILRDLYKAVKGRDIEVLIYTPEELDRISHRRFIRKAWQEGKVIYES
jgi:predicted nucleotidyltransferase